MIGEGENLATSKSRQCAGKNQSRVDAPTSVLRILGIMPKRLKKRSAALRHLLLKLRCAIAITTRPRFGPILMPAISPRMRILHRKQFEEFFPIRPLLIQRRRAKTSLHPLRHTISIYTCLLHVMPIFVPRNRPTPKLARFNRTEQRRFLSRFNTGFHQITHGVLNIPEIPPCRKGSTFERNHIFSAKLTEQSRLRS